MLHWAETVGSLKTSSKLQLTLEQTPDFQRSIYMWVFKINILENFGEICKNLKNLVDESCSPEISKKMEKEKVKYVMNA